MQQENTGDINIVNTTPGDLPFIRWLFERVMDLQGKNGYQVWTDVDQRGLEKDIESGLQYKIVRGSDILCIFSIQFKDPFIWRERDRGDALYLHRIVAHPGFKGQRQFQAVLDWSRALARERGLSYLRMDTWASNARIISYYKSFGFVFMENYRTPDTPELPRQNRDLEVALLELDLRDG